MECNPVAIYSICRFLLDSWQGTSCLKGRAGMVALCLRPLHVVKGLSQQ